MTITIAMSVSDHTTLKKSYLLLCKFYIICMDIQRVSNSFSNFQFVFQKYRFCKDYTSLFTFEKISLDILTSAWPLNFCQLIIMYIRKNVVSTNN